MKRSGDRIIARDRVIGQIDTTPTAVIRSDPERARRRIEGSMHFSFSQGVRNVTAEARRRGVFGNSLQRAVRTIAAVMREIFDESAYERFLARTDAVRSVASYREFMQEREAAMVRKPRCC